MEGECKLQDLIEKTNCVETSMGLGLRRLFLLFKTEDRKNKEISKGTKIVRRESLKEKQSL